jgi:hypothetical protein
MSAKSPGLVSLPDTMIESLHENGADPDPHCLEKRVYYKVISGMSELAYPSLVTDFCQVYTHQYLFTFATNGSTKPLENGDPICNASSIE